MQECRERIDQRGAAGRALLILRVARLPAPRALFSIIRTPLLPLRRTLGDILRLTIIYLTQISYAFVWLNDLADKFERSN